MIFRPLFAIASVAALTAALFTAPAVAQDGANKLRVVATFSILGDFARNVGGDRATVRTLVGPNGDIHVYEPTAADAETMHQAQLVVVNGLGLEGWLSRLVQSSGSRAATVVASRGIAPRTFDPGELRAGLAHAAGAVDPHAWQSVENAQAYVVNIRDAMKAADPADADVYERNAATYLESLKAIDADVRHAISQVAPDRRTVITTHAAFGYYAAAYGMTFVAPQGTSTDSEPSALDVATIIKQIRARKVRALFLENIADPRLIRQIASETGARIGGTLYSDSLSPPDGPAASYVAMIRHNTDTILHAVEGEAAAQK